MTPRETMIEAIARAIYARRTKGLLYCYDWDDPGLDEDHPGVRKSIVAQATAALDAYHAALPALGLGVVPVEADEYMREIVRENSNTHRMNWFFETWKDVLAAATNPLEARDE